MKNNFTHFPSLIYGKSGSYYYLDEDQTLWNVYEYIDGRHIEYEEMRGGIGELLGKFHTAAMGIEMVIGLNSFSSDLLSIFKDNSAVEVLLKNEGIGRISEFYDFCRDNKEAYDELPKTIVHGDFNLNNVMLTKDGFKLIDFEFVRYDLRLVDLVSLLLPVRDDQGEFLYFGNRHLDHIMKEYNDSLGKNLQKISKKETSCMLEIAFLYFLKIAGDMYISGNRYYRNSIYACNIILDLVSQHKIEKTLI